MVSYKQHLFLSIIDNISINENYNSNSINLLDLLLEAPIDDKTVTKMIADKKRVSVYYQGDNKSKKGWYSVEPIRVDKKNGSSYLLAYSIPKDGGKPSLQYFSQPKIVNWNILGKKDVTLSKDYEKKLFKFFKDPKVPKEQKLSYAERLKKVGVKVGDFLKKAAVTTAIAGTVLMPFKDNIKQYLRQQATHIAQLYNTRDLRSKDFRSEDLKMMGMLINNAIKDGENKSNADSGVVTYNQYRTDIASDVAKGDMMSAKQVSNQLMQDPEVLVALTLGQFSYQKNDDGSYTVTDKYDFSKWKTINTKKDEVKDLSYPAALRKIMTDNNVGIYPAIRHMAYLEAPDDVPGAIAKKVKVTIPADYVTTYDLASITDYGTD
jgi:hypothetical protein